MARAYAAITAAIAVRELSTVGAAGVTAELLTGGATTGDVAAGAVAGGGATGAL